MRELALLLRPLLLKPMNFQKGWSRRLVALAVLGGLSALVALLYCRSARKGLEMEMKEASHARASLMLAEQRLANCRRDIDRLKGLLGGIKQRKAGTAPGMTTPDVAAIEFAVHSIPRRVWEQRVLAKDPKLQALYLGATRAGIPARYIALWRALDLPNDQVATFTDLMMQATEQTLDIESVAQSQGMEDSDPAITALKQDALDHLNASEIELLGESGFEQLQHYERALPMQEFVNAFAGDQAVAGTPISPGQASQLTKIMAQANPGFQGGAAADAPIVQSFDENIIAHVPMPEPMDPNVVLPLAQNILSTAQYGPFEGQINRNHYAIQVFNGLLQAPGDPMMGFAMWRM